MFETAKREILIPLTEMGHTAFICGGSIRSFLFREDPHDVDIATDAPDEVIQDLFPGSIDVSKNMNLKVFLASVGNFKYEIAHFRGNETYQNHRHPNTVEFVNDAKLDAQRRDFTINGMFMDAYGNIVDYVDGLGDVKNKVLRAIGDPTVRFDEDMLRILRGIRFAVQYDLEIEEETRRAMFNNCQHLIELTPERVIDEFDKMMTLGGFKFSRALKIMRDTGVLGVLLPEIAVLDKFDHDPRYHPEGNCLAHTIAAVRACDSTDSATLWSVMLHDVGKATTYMFREKKGEWRHTYYGHDKAGIPIIEQLSERLKLPNKTREIAKFCADKHMLCHRIHEMKPAKILNLVEHPYFEYLMVVSDCDVASRGDDSVTPELIRRRDFITRFREKTRHILSITGATVMEECNIESGPTVGLVLRKIREWVANTCETDGEKIRRKLIDLGKSC